jgi:DNA excision repair protein ERCC-3
VTGPKVEPQYTDEQFAEALEDIFSTTPFVTTRMLMDAVGCSREVARQRLVSLAEDDVFTATEVGGSVRAYYHPDAPTAALDAIKHDVSDSGGGSQASDSDVGFFPSRREFAVRDPGKHTREVMSKTAHLVDSSGEWFLYKVSSEDVWNAPYDSFSDLSDALQSVVGEDWDSGFESRIAEDWEDANTFSLKTHDDGFVVLSAPDSGTLENVAKRHLEHNDHYTQYVDESTLRVKNGASADVKEVLYEHGYPVEDARRLSGGESLDVSLDPSIELRGYQREWVDSFMERKSGTFVGPSGSGKTIAALGVMGALGGETLVVTPNREIAAQWREELLEKTDLSASEIGEYHGGEKKVRPVTITTYDTTAMSRHRDLFDEREWGLVVADECHHAVSTTWKRFRNIQSKARLGLSATPVRESGSAQEIYTLIGPPVGSDWGRLFSEGWVSRPDVSIVMVPWASDRERERYEHATGTGKMVAAASNSKKEEVVGDILDKHDGKKAIVFVDYIEQGEALADSLGVSFISGETPHDTREELYDDFRDGWRSTLVISRVGDEGIDLPDAGVAILASTMGSSNAQTGQRAGRTMRPDSDSKTYVLLTKGSGEADWGRESTRFLAEQGADVTKVDYRDL